MNNLPTIGEITADQISQLSKAGIIPTNTPPEQVQIFAQICREKGISPFQKHIYLLRYGSQYQAIMGIDGFRYIAGMTGQHAGTEISYNNGLSLDEVLQLKQHPRTARCVVKKAIAGVLAEFVHEVSMSEFKGSGKWKTMPFQMLGKCAEAFALKKAFPEHLSGLHVPEEKAAFENTTVQAQSEEVEDSELIYDDLAGQVAQYDDSEALMKAASEFISKAVLRGMEQLDIEKLKQFINECIVNLRKENK